MLRNVPLCHSIDMSAQLFSQDPGVLNSRTCLLYYCIHFSFSGY